MSIEEKNEIESKHPVTQSWMSGKWKKARVLIPLYDMVKVAVIIYGVGVMLESKVAEVLSIPKRTTALEKKDSAKFQDVDSSLIRHNGYFSILFKHVDTVSR